VAGTGVIARRDHLDGKARRARSCRCGELGVVADAGEAGVTVLDRFLAVGVSREEFDAHLAVGRIAVAGERVTDPATPAPAPTAVAIMLDQR
jgi:hypothetical protein